MRIFIALLLLLPLATASAGGFLGKPEYVTWQEEVKLNDGRVIVVTQKKRCFGAYTGGNYASCIAREAWLTIKLPEFGSKEIVWHENLSPRVLNIHAGKLYVIGVAPTCLEFRKYGMPKPKYIGFMFETGQWKRIPFEVMPEAIYDTNMLIEAFPPNDIKFLSLLKKEELNGSPGYSSQQRRIDLNVKSNCH